MKKRIISLLVASLLLLCTPIMMTAFEQSDFSTSYKVLNYSGNNYLVLLNGLKRSLYQIDNDTASTIEASPNANIEITDGNIITIDSSQYANVSEVPFDTLDYTYETCPCYQVCPGYVYLDLDMREWYHDGIHFCLDNEIMNGIGDNNFGPHDYCTRAQLITILYRIAGSPDVNIGCTFSDVYNYDYYYTSLSWAQANGIISGYDDNTFRPEDAITREQVATILFKFTAYLNKSTYYELYDMSRFTDSINISDYAIESLNWSIYNGIIKGNDFGEICPNLFATRCECATFIQRCCTKLNIEIK